MYVCNCRTNSADVILSFHISASRSELEEDSVSETQEFEIAKLKLDKVTIIIL